MSAAHDLQVDTHWIRSSAATVEETAHQFAAAAPGTSPWLSAAALGSDPAAVAAARLIGLRCAQAQDAAVQLADVAIGTAQRLTLAADTFDRLEAGVGGPR